MTHAIHCTHWLAFDGVTLVILSLGSLCQLSPNYVWLKIATCNRQVTKQSAWSFIDLDHQPCWIVVAFFHQELLHRERQRERDRDRYKQPHVHESNQHAQWELFRLYRVGIQRACNRHKLLLNKRPHRLVVRTSRRGRDFPGSIPGVVTICRIINDLRDHVFAWLKI